MGALDRRIVALERRDRERAVERIRTFWRSMSARECALLCAWAKAQEAGTTAPPGSQALAETKRAEIEEALQKAICWREDMPDEERAARIEHLLSEVDPLAGRKETVGRHYEALMGERA